MRRRKNNHADAHAACSSCLWATDTNKGCWGFDSMQQAATAQQGWPFTACQLTLLQEASTKSHRMWDSHKSDTVTSNLRHAGAKRQTHTHTHPCHPPVLLLLCSGAPAGLSDCQSHWWAMLTPNTVPVCPQTIPANVLPAKPLSDFRNTSSTKVKNIPCLLFIKYSVSISPAISFLSFCVVFDQWAEVEMLSHSVELLAGCWLHFLKSAVQLSVSVSFSILFWFNSCCFTFSVDTENPTLFSKHSQVLSLFTALSLSLTNIHQRRSQTGFLASILTFCHRQQLGPEFHSWQW